MKHLLLLLLLVALAPPASAQEQARCSTGGSLSPDSAVAPDTTDWRRYFPLAVGNAWEYRQTSSQSRGTSYFYVEVASDTTVNEITYYRTRSRYRGSTYLAYDTTRHIVVGTDTLGGKLANADPTYDAFMDAPPDLQSGSAYRSGISIGDSSVTAPIKEFGDLGGCYPTGSRFAKDIGPILYTADGWGTGLIFKEELIYAKVGERIYGERATGTGRESPDLPAGKKIKIEALYPNPTRARTRLRFVAAQPQRVEIYLYDAMGRKLRQVRDQRYGAGKQEITFAAGDLTAGVYYVTVKGETMRVARALAVVK